MYLSLIIPILIWKSYFPTAQLTKISVEFILIMYKTKRLLNYNNRIKIIFRFDSINCLFFDARKNALYMRLNRSVGQFKSHDVHAHFQGQIADLTSHFFYNIIARSNYNVSTFYGIAYKMGECDDILKCPGYLSFTAQTPPIVSDTAIFNNFHTFVALFYCLCLVFALVFVGVTFGARGAVLRTTHGRFCY